MSVGTGSLDIEEIPHILADIQSFLHHGQIHDDEVHSQITSICEKHAAPYEQAVVKLLAGDEQLPASASRM